MSEEGVSVTEGIEEFLSSGDRSLEVLFGSQSGNAEGLAAKFAKTAKSYGLEGSVHDMDGFDFNSLSSNPLIRFAFFPYFIIAVAIDVSLL